MLRGRRQPGGDQPARPRHREPARRRRARRARHRRRRHRPRRRVRVAVRHGRAAPRPTGALVRGFVINKLRGDPALLARRPARARRAGPACRRSASCRGCDDVGIDAEDSLALAAAHRVAAPPSPTCSTSPSSASRGSPTSPTSTRSPSSPACACASCDRGDARPARPRDPPGHEGDGRRPRAGCASEGSTGRRRGDRRAVLGICGGYQMLGHTIADPVESGRGDVAGLGHLDVDTVFEPTKLDRQRRGESIGQPVTGYEIRHGRVRAAAAHRAGSTSTTATGERTMARSTPRRGAGHEPARAVRAGRVPCHVPRRGRATCRQDLRARGVSFAAARDARSSGSPTSSRRISTWPPSTRSSKAPPRDPRAHQRRHGDPRPPTRSWRGSRPGSRRCGRRTRLRSSSRRDSTACGWFSFVSSGAGGRGSDRSTTYAPRASSGACRSSRSAARWCPTPSWRPRRPCPPTSWRGRSSICDGGLANLDHLLRFVADRLLGSAFGFAPPEDVPAWRSGASRCSTRPFPRSASSSTARRPVGEHPVRRRSVPRRSGRRAPTRCPCSAIRCECSAHQPPGLADGPRGCPAAGSCPRA